MISQAVILAGGKGTRMQNFTDTPKALLEIQGKTLLEHQILCLTKHGIRDIVLLLGFQSDKFLEICKQLELTYSVSINLSVEERSRGTGVALLEATKALDETFLLLHGDLAVWTDLQPLIRTMEDPRFDFAMLYHPSAHPEDSDLLRIKNHEEVLEFIRKPHDEEGIRPLGNAGLYAFRKATIDFCKGVMDDAQETKDLDRDLIPNLLKNGKRAACVRNVGFVQDCGTPKRLLDTITKWPDVSTKTFRKPAIFFDRDGTLIEENGYITEPNQVKLRPEVARTIRTLKNLGYWILVVTNQPVIARGDITEAELDAIHSRIEKLVRYSGAEIDDFFFCPHHPDKGYEGERLDLKVYCDCRKPKTGLISKALEIYPIDLQKSWVVGDSWRDVGLAQNVGLPVIIVGQSPIEISVDHKVSSFSEIVDIVARKPL